MKIDVASQVKCFVRLADNYIAFQCTFGRIYGTHRGLYTPAHFHNLDTFPEREIRDRSQAVQIFGTWIAKHWPDPFRVIRLATRREKDKFVYQVYDDEVLVWEKEVYFSHKTDWHLFNQTAREQDAIADKLANNQYV